MEFHVWGKLDESGKIQSVQSSCSHGNNFNLFPDQVSPSWIDQFGEKYVPYSTKKDLVYKLDSKMDEMSLIMVQLGELTKRVRLQEKLIAEYEEKAQRKKDELDKLKAENDQLRSMVYKRKRNDSFLDSDSAVTSSKTVGSSMDLSDNLNESQSAPDLTSHSPHGYISMHPVHSHAGETPEGAPIGSVNGGLPIDKNGYVPLTAVPTSSNLDVTEGKNMCLDEVDSVCHNRNVRFSVTFSENWCRDTSSDDSEPCDDVDGILLNENGDTWDGQVFCKETPDIDKPTYHRKTMEKTCGYTEIPDNLVSDLGSSHFTSTVETVTTSVTSSVRCHEDRYKKRPPMPLPNGKPTDIPERRVSEPTTYNLPHSPECNEAHSHTSKLVKPTTNDGNEAVHVSCKRHTLLHRHSSPDINTEIHGDVKINKHVQNMRTTMEWNESRKLLMSKSNTCTAENAEEALRGVVKDSYHLCEAWQKRGHRHGGSTRSLPQKICNALKKTGKYDDDILTTEFIEKCVRLWRSV